ncbi:hypothetical protein, partial [Modicisalibacter ilicicola]|uniref:hypothetical protein n=1 Tax=Modicisalibacter ilicicola TaxID=480814 RepID=UPI001C316EA6
EPGSPGDAGQPSLAEASSHGDCKAALETLLLDNNNKTPRNIMNKLPTSMTSTVIALALPLASPQVPAPPCLAGKVR